MSSSGKKGALLEFIECYRDLPVLWDVEHPNYRNRVKKTSAYEMLAEKLKVIEPDATRDTVVKKINNLRSTFRKELKKCNESKSSGASPDSVYTPSLWYFNDLMFLVDSEVLRRNLSTNELDDEVALQIEVDSEDVKHSPNSRWAAECHHPKYPAIPTAQETSTLRNALLNDMPNSRWSTDCHHPKYIATPKDMKPLKLRNSPPNDATGLESERTPLDRRKRKASPLPQDLLLPTTTFLEEDEYLLMAKNYAIKLRKLTPEQLLFADRVINEALLEAQFQKLSRWTFLTHPEKPFFSDQSNTP